MSNGRFSGINQRIADRLLAEGRIKREDHQRAIDYATRTKNRIEEALIDLEILTEADLLKFIATVHNTRFVSSDKLSKAVIDGRVLMRVPVRTADAHGVFPVLYDDKTGVLSVVTADPDNDVALHEIKLTAGVKEVRALAARPAAVRAAIAYHYRSDRAAFQALLRPAGIELFSNDPFDRRSTGSMVTQQPGTPPKIGLATGPGPGAAPAQAPQPVGPTQTWAQAAPQVPFGPPQQGFPMGPQQAWPQQPQQGAPPPGWTQNPQQAWAQQAPQPQGYPMPPQQAWPQQGPQPQGYPMGPQQAWGPQQGAPFNMPFPMGPQAAPNPAPPAAAPFPVGAAATPAPPPAQASPPSPPPAAPAAPAKQRNRSITPTKIDQFLAPPQPLPSAPPSTAPPAPAPKESPSNRPPAPKTSAGSAALPAAASPQLVESLNVLVSLLENSRADLRGHSSMVARLTRKTCERIGLSALQTAAFTAAAYLHDLGKMGAYHLTALNVSEYEGHRVAAMKAIELPVHLMESVGLLPETTSAISSMYERYDGEGIPNGQGGKDIPLGARILAVADTYADLTQNPRNPYRKILRPFEACEVLMPYRGTVFDPNIVDIFRQSTTGEDMRAKLLSDRHEALIVDPDPEETTVLELRLIEQGFEVKIARTVAQAKKILAENEIDAVVSEIDLDTPDAGLALRGEMRKDPKGKDLTWVVLTGKTDRQAAQRAFDLGVDDFVLKPVSTDIFAAKLRQLIERRAQSSGGGAARGVSGSLTEMSLPDMIQILWHGRKTCALRINEGASSGEIDFAEGQVVDARWDALRGEDAFYKMLTLREGEFRLDPTFKPTTRSIEASPEALLLEGMRRLDEASV
jgi:response regulator RpfG family c-di-GMP phosphodiesterase